MNNIPFKIKNLWGGMVQADGLLALDEAAGELRFQFQTRDTLLGVIQSGVRTVAVSLTEITGIACRKSLFGSSVTIQLSDMKVAGDIPGQTSGLIQLKVERKHLRAAQDMAAMAEFAMADLRLRRMRD